MWLKFVARRANSSCPSSAARTVRLPSASSVETRSSSWMGMVNRRLSMNPTARAMSAAAPRDQDGSELHAAHRCEGLRCRAFHHDRPFDALNRGHRAEELGRRIIALDGVGAGQPERRRGAEKILDQWGFRGVAADGALFGCCDDPPGSVHQPDQEPAAGAVFQALLHRAQIEHPGQRAPRGFAVGGQRVGDHGRQGAGGGVEAAAGDAVQRLSVGRADYPLEGAPAGVIEAGVAGEGALTAAVHDLEVHHRPTEVRGGLGERLGESFGADRGIGLDDPPGGLETGLVTGDGQ
jgi:hypothetical protein